jgi:hypothetical protein
MLYHYNVNIYDLSNIYLTPDRRTDVKYLQPVLSKFSDRDKIYILQKKQDKLPKKQRKMYMNNKTYLHEI